MTPPPTPQNELSSESSSQVKLKSSVVDDGSRRIVLNAVNEPPIVFLSDFDTDNKLSQLKEKIDAPAAANEPVTSIEATISGLKKGEEVNVANPGIKNKR